MTSFPSPSAPATVSPTPTPGPGEDVTTTDTRAATVTTAITSAISDMIDAHIQDAISHRDGLSRCVARRQTGVKSADCRRAAQRLAAALVVLVAGCEPARPPRPTLNGEAVGRIVARSESTSRHLTAVQPLTSPAGRPLLAAAEADQAGIRGDAAVVRAQEKALSAAVQDAEAKAIRERQARERAEGHWYVRWGRRIERTLWAIGISWLVLGIASVVLGMGNPLSWGWRIGKEITRLVPAMNVFSWIRDWLLRRKQGVRKR